MPTIDSWLKGLNRVHQSVGECPAWPPDLFAICGSLLKISGAYLHIFERTGGESRWDDVRRAGNSWVAKFDKLKHPTLAEWSGVVPQRVRRDWTWLMTRRMTAISEIKEDVELADVLIRLTLTADVASAGIGITTEATPFLTAALTILRLNDQQSFTWDVPRESVCVLGKQHTPQRGATFRSLTHHLSLYWPNDIEGRWIGPYGRGPVEGPSDTVSLLLLPWPATVNTEDFRVPRKDRTGKGSKTTKYFEFDPVGGLSLAGFRRKLSKALKEARQHAERIDAVVFPELALNEDQFNAAERLALEAKVMLICGVRLPGRAGSTGFNLCVLQPTGMLLAAKDGRRLSKKSLGSMTDSVRCIQSKHHRWCLDAGQIRQYQLGGRIPPCDAMWENIELLPRKLHFVTLGEWMTWCVLICEDLARQDPAADLIRSVGPNLLITLLMDGPQLKSRWAARYASVLAEDPGTSVLALTSLGMAERSRPSINGSGQRSPVSRAIALWRDVELGEHEITLDEGDDACILTLVCTSRKEISADGRDDGQKAHFPVYAGYKSFRVDA